jgi:hypothetical protein
MPNQILDPADHGAVVRWVLTTVRLVRRAAGKPPAAQEHLEAEADERIVGPVQGNRCRAPVRHDRDRIVRRAIQWGLDELAVAPAA